jgi:hypothetical protein
LTFTLKKVDIICRWWASANPESSFTFSKLFKSPDIARFPSGASFIINSDVLKFIFSVWWQLHDFISVVLLFDMPAFVDKSWRLSLIFSNVCPFFASRFLADSVKATGIASV